MRSRVVHHTARSSMSTSIAGSGSLEETMRETLMEHNILPAPQRKVRFWVLWLNASGHTFPPTHSPPDQTPTAIHEALRALPRKPVPPAHRLEAGGANRPVPRRGLRAHSALPRGPGECFFCYTLRAAVSHAHTFGRWSVDRMLIPHTHMYTCMAGAPARALGQAGDFEAQRRPRLYNGLHAAQIGHRGTLNNAITGGLRGLNGFSDRGTGSPCHVSACMHQCRG